MLLFLLLSHLPSSSLPGTCWQLSKINFPMSSAPGEAEALKRNDFVLFSCPHVLFPQSMTAEPAHIPQWTVPEMLFSAPWWDWAALQRLPPCLISSQEGFSWELLSPVNSLQGLSWCFTWFTLQTAQVCSCFRILLLLESNLKHQGSALHYWNTGSLYPCLCNLVSVHFAWLRASLCHRLSTDVVPAAAPSLCSNGKLHYQSWALLVIKSHHKMSDLILACVPILSSALGKWYLTGQSRIWQIVPFEKVGRKMFLISQSSLLCFIFFFLSLPFWEARRLMKGVEQVNWKLLAVFKLRFNCALQGHKLEVFESNQSVWIVPRQLLFLKFSSQKYF